ncbi:UbiC transcription regulator-associated [Cutibacterium acnes JCM 18909]|nr:UbiC transcription regulator-associated [Cutibacterium acnes JCM 18909]
MLDWTVETAPPAVAAALGLPSNSEVTHFRRLRMSQDEPLAIMTNWVRGPRAQRRRAENHWFL